jgi:hypothetical protein
MGKAKNRKRAKMLRERKKEQEALQVKKSPGIKEIETRLTKLHGEKGVKIQNTNSPKKISNLVIEMIEPLKKSARSFNAEQNIIGLGIMAWNLGIIKTFRGEEEMLKAIDQFGMELPVDYKNLLLEYAEIKCSKYADYDQLIHDYEYKSVNKKNNNLTVAYKSINED